jgi:hypothetical protein
MRIPEQWFNELEDLTEVDNTPKTSYTDNTVTSNGDTIMLTKQEMIATLVDLANGDDMFDIPTLQNATYEDVKDLYDIMTESYDTEEANQ